MKNERSNEEDGLPLVRLIYMFRLNSILRKVQQILVVMLIENRNSVRQINVERYGQYHVDQMHSLNNENILPTKTKPLNKTLLSINVSLLSLEYDYEIWPQE